MQTLTCFFFTLLTFTAVDLRVLNYQEYQNFQNMPLIGGISPPQKITVDVINMLKNVFIFIIYIFSAI